MRMAALLDLDTLYSIDASSLAEDLMKLDSIFTDDLFEDYDFISDDPFSKIYKEWYTYLDHLILEMDLLSYYKLINSEEYDNYYNGHYLLGDFNVDTHRGADALAVYWINRNLRMFRNIQNLVSDDQDRILVVVGNGHAALLRYLFQWSPEFRYVDFNDIEIKSIDHDRSEERRVGKEIR